MPPASIRPRHQCRGCQAMALLAPDQGVGFNSATTPMPWMRQRAGRPAGQPAQASIRPRHQCRGCPGRGVFYPPQTTLQFGHDTNAVDAGTVAGGTGGQVGASIRPRHQCRGCLYGSRTSDRGRRSLQFGHDTNAVDAGAVVGRRDGTRPASIRPRHQCRGCPAPGGREPGGPAASIRPRHQCRGCDAIPGRAGPDARASIRPRHQCRGCRCGSRPSRGTRRRLQFGHDTNAVDAPYHERSSALVGLLQFGHDTNAVDASTYRWTTFPKRRFNSATTPMPWMPRPDGTETAGVVVLQFGHDTNAVDAEGVGSALLGGEVASIRPRHQCRGCWWSRPAPGPHPPASIRPRHQCRGCQAKNQHFAAKLGLQFGHDTNAVDARGPAVRPGRRAAGFNSATTPMPWMRQPDCRLSGTERRFNSATTPMPWMLGTNVKLTVANPASIRPRHQCRGCLNLLLDRGLLVAASIRPRHQCRGCTKFVSTNGREPQASIRPRHQCRGCPSRPCHTAGPGVASIRPRHQCRGCSGCTPRRCRR